MNDKKWWQFWKNNEQVSTLSNQLEVIAEDMQSSTESIDKAYALKPHDLSNMMMLDGGGGPGYFFDDATDRQFDYSTLDKLSRHNIASAIVQTRINQVSEFSNPTEENSSDPIGFRIKKRDGSLPSDEEHLKIKQLERFIVDCGSETIDFELTFESFLRQIVRDSLVYDQANFEVVRNKAGKIIAFLPVDASTIRRAKSNDSEIKYVQVKNNKIISEFKEEELCFGVRRPRTSLGVKKYGHPELEELYQTLNHIYNAETYNASNFTNGISAAGIIAVKSKMNPKLFRAFRKEFYQMLTGTHNSKKTPLIQLDPDANEDLKALNLSASNAEMEYSQWINYLIKVTCAIYQMDPAEIGFVFGNESQRSTAVQSDPSARVLMGKEKGLRPLLRAIQSWINKYIVYQIDPNYQFEFIGIDAVSALDKQRIQKGRALYMTVNELRALSGLAEIEGGDIIADAYSKIITAKIKDDDEPVVGVQKDYEDDDGEFLDNEEYISLDKKKVKNEDKQMSSSQQREAFLEAFGKTEYSDAELDKELERVKKLKWDFSFLEKIDWKNFRDDDAIFEVPELIQDIAKDIIKLREEKGDEVKGGTRIGWTRARQLANGDKLSLNIIERMYSFWVRHKRNGGVKPEHKDTPWKDNGWTAIQIWGGHEAGIWCEKLLYEIDKYISKDAEK